ncbi:hypothetical protein KDU71_14135 [Carboxylicivirga sediminis]|uniref:Transglutaminase-like domain-containing protein n=1 Tax=Carboxylicivirga sediminis TaxID=2006564 RepID=A0A941F4L8_9BACT|nr:hypothetical protein [Carboxylicivirga sediminis]MBR8536711.1 hypothetical protein [Carboxylicivirga sediminis]
MEASTKKILGTLAAVAAVGGGFYLIKKGKKLLAGAKMNFALLGFRIHKMNLQEVQFAVKLRCYNPTKAPITLAVNQVVANYKGSAIAYSTPDIKGLTVGAGSTQEPEILFQVPYLNLVGKGLSTALLQNTAQLKADMSFTLSLSINGETITTTQNLTDESHTARLGSLNTIENNTTMRQNMNGLALGELGIVSGPRNTQDGRKFNHLIKKASGTDVFVKNGNVLETVESCIEIIAEHFREVEELASMLQGDNMKASCKNIFDFSYKYLQYHKDEDGTEQLRTPARSWLDGQMRFKQKGIKSAGIDCDDYSIFVGSLLKNLGIPFKLRITKYDGKKNFQHIYVIVPALGDSEDEIVIDPVLSKFDYQKPYSFEQSNFDMSPVQMAGLKGIDGLTGSSSLGLPISILSGIDLAGGHQAKADHEELIAIVSGVDFDDAINGLGDADDATYRYLVRTRNFLLKNKENKDKMAHIQNPDQFISMLDQAIKFWNTPQRDKVLAKLESIEARLAQKGLIKYDIDAIEGLAELDDLDESIDGLNGDRGLGGFFKSLKRIGRKIGKGIKKAAKKVGKVAKKVAKAIVRFNPLSIAIRNGLLAALRLNMFGIAKKLQYAYLPDQLASKYNIDAKKLKDLKKRHRRVRKLFKGLQGREKNLRKAILKGAKQKSRDFSLKGVDGLLADLQGLEAIGELGELGQMGAVATAASVGAATGVLAKIKSWLKPVKNIFTKIKSKFSKAKKVKNTVSQYVPSNSDTQVQEASHYVAPQTSSYTPQPIMKSGNYSPQTTSLAPMITQTVAPTKKGMSKGAKIGIGIGVVALIGTGAYFAFRKKDDDKPKQNTQSKKSFSKKALGSIELQ